MAAASSAVEGADREMTLDVPEAVVDIARRLEEAGYETWTVGGAVRDELLGGHRADWDLATAAPPETVQKLFRPSYPIGLDFGTVGVRGLDGKVYEVTTFRRDIETDGRHAVVEYSDDLDEDLARRDFTINAIAYHPLRQRIHDPFGGHDDLNRRVLRSVGGPAERFAEDYLRILRGLRFAGRYALTIEPATWNALCAGVVNLPRLSGERLREELLKVMGGPGGGAALHLYRESGALAAILPELADLEDERWHRRARAIESLAPTRPFLRLVLLLEPAAARLAAIAERLRFSNAETRAARELVAGVSRALPPGGDRAAARRWLRDVGRVRSRDVLRLRAALARSRDADARELAARLRTVLDVLRRREPVAVADLAIDGNDLQDLGLEPSPRFAEILDDCLDYVLEDPGRNRRDVLLAYVRERYAG